MSLCNCAACQRRKLGISMTDGQHIEQLIRLWNEREEAALTTQQAHNYFFNYISRPTVDEKVYVACTYEDNRGWTDQLLLFKNIADLIYLYCDTENNKPFTITEQEFRSYLTFS